MPIVSFDAKAQLLGICIIVDDAAHYHVSQFLCCVFLYYFSLDVNFCGYTVPHPADPKMHLRIQASRDVRAVDVLRRGLADLEKVCDHTITTFEEAYREHEEST